MTYIDYLNQFNRWCESESPTDKVVVLYHFLLDLFNRRGWPRQTGVDTQRLMILAHTSDKKVALRARDTLRDAGFISVIPGKKGKATVYSLLNFGSQSTTENDTENATQNATESDTQNATENATPNKNKIKTKNTSSSDLPPESPDRKKSGFCFDKNSKQYQTAAWLDEAISERAPYYKRRTEAQLQKWSNVFDRMNRLDGIPWDILGKVLFYSQEDSFWQDNILSADKFREKFFQLESKMNKEEGQDAG